MKPTREIVFRVLPDGPTIRATGREAWTLRNLIDAGSKGVSGLVQIGPRLSAYVFDLKRMGIDIEARREPHGGPFPGHHARYVLRSPVEVIEETKRAAA